MPDPLLAAALAATGRALAAAGLAPGASGNLSVRTRRGIIVTPTGTRMRDLDPDDLSLLDPDGTLLKGRRPSKEWPLHVEILRSRPEVNAIVHLHAPDSVAVACLADLDPDDAIPAYTAYRVMRIGRLPLVPYRPPGDQRLGVAAGEAASRAGRGLLLANHGLVAWGADLDEAAGVAEEVEAAAALHLRLRGLPVRLLTHDEIEELGRRFG